MIYGILETERLFLREMDMNDYDALYSVYRDVGTGLFCFSRIKIWMKK